MFVLCVAEIIVLFTVDEKVRCTQCILCITMESKGVMRLCEFKKYL